MGASFWIKRFLVVLAGAFIIICGVQMLKGHDFSYSAEQGAIWGLITSGVFTFSRFFQARRGQHCAICKDTQEMRDSGSHDSS